MNNNVGNLYWGTREDNMRQCISDNRFYFVGKYRKKSVDESGIIPDRYGKKAKDSTSIPD